jgi:hypothetical protein
MGAISHKVKTELLKFNQRKLEKGEIFLLSKAIADELPLMPPDEEHVKYFILNHKRFIEYVLYGISEFSYLDKEQMDAVYKLVSELSLWRAEVAYNPPVILFKGNYNTVIDDLSALPRFVDNTYMCALADIVSNANYLYCLFRDFVKETKLNALEG